MKNQVGRLVPLFLICVASVTHAAQWRPAMITGLPVNVTIVHPTIANETLLLGDLNRSSAKAEALCVPDANLACNVGQARVKVLLSNDRAVSRWDVASLHDPLLLRSFALTPNMAPLAFSPQSSPLATPATPTRTRSGFWTPRRLIVLGIGAGLAATGAALWMNGKNLPNPNYNPSLCQSALLSGGVGVGNSAGDAAVGEYCNQTLPSTSKKAGLWIMVGGGSIFGLGFLPGL